MFFTVISSEASIPSSSQQKAFLREDNWNDWFEFKTLYSLVVFDEEGEQHSLGGVKIGQFNMEKEQARPKIPKEFDELGDVFFSLGQDDNYYERMKIFSSFLKQKLLTGLSDVVANPSLFERAIEERVTRISLLRYVTPVSVRGQFRRLVEGGSRLSRYDFSYKAPSRGTSLASSFELDFEVQPESNPPTNIHVLIGRNGVGKTRILNNMARSLVDDGAAYRQVGKFDSQEVDDNQMLFANLVSVTFSAFDNFQPLREKRDKALGIKYSYVGLKRFISSKGEVDPAPKSPTMLATEFINSVKAMRHTSRSERWERALEMLEADPIFKEAELTSLVDIEQGDNFEKNHRKVFENLSSGHKIVLLTITRLVETVEERTLVLLDEPEAHLHPPLLSAFIRALSDLLIYQNGVAIIATHSPVLLQEVPKNCAWKLRRSGFEAAAERPEIETFGENVGVLTREVFGLEVTQSGFHKLLQDAVEEGNSYRVTLREFNNEIGAEGRAILKALIAARDAEEEISEEEEF